MQCDHQKVLEMAQAGDWEGAHSIVQKHSDELSCLVHGYLHRVEGDLANTAYWYGQGQCQAAGEHVGRRVGAVVHLAVTERTGQIAQYVRFYVQYT